MRLGGVIRLSGTWMAGCYMNSGIYRTASLYHRVLKIVTGKKAQLLKAWCAHPQTTIAVTSKTSAV